MTPKRVLPQTVLFVTKFRFLGDTLLAVPTFRAARAAWPDARLVLLTGYPARTLLENCPYLDEAWAFDPHARDAGMHAYFSLVGRIRRVRFDAFLTLNRSFHSALTPTLAGVPVRAGFRAEGRDFLLNRLTDYDREKPETECFGDILRLLAPGAETHTAPQLWVTQSETDAAQGRLRAAFGGTIDRSMLVGIQPGASLENKRWPAERWAELAQALARNGAHIVLIGGPDETQAARNTLALLRDTTPVANFVGECTLRASLGLLSQLGAFVAGDTAMRHAAAALGVPTVALFGPTGAGKWATLGHAVLQGAGGDMNAISVDAVRETVRPFLACQLAGAVAP